MATAIKPTAPPERLLRERQFIPSLIPMGRSSWWRGVKSGRYPQPIKLGPRTTVWRESDIAKLSAELGALDGQPVAPDSHTPPAPKPKPKPKPVGRSKNAKAPI